MHCKFLASELMRTDESSRMLGGADACGDLCGPSVCVRTDLASFLCPGSSATAYSLKPANNMTAVPGMAVCVTARRRYFFIRSSTAETIPTIPVLMVGSGTGANLLE